LTYFDKIEEERKRYDRGTRPQEAPVLQVSQVNVVCPEAAVSATPERRLQEALAPVSQSVNVPEQRWRRRHFANIKLRNFEFV